MRYTNIGDEVTVPATIVQATLALDVAAKFAQDTKDQETMLRVADSWMKLAGLMADLEEAANQKPEPKQDKVKMGFQAPEEIGEEEDDVRSDDSDA